MIAPHELIIASADLVVAAADVATNAVSTADAAKAACGGFWPCLVDWNFWLEGSGNVSEVIRNISIIAGFVVGGLVGFWLAFVRTRAAARQGRAAIGGHITDRYAKAVEQLGNKGSLHVRLGGIYALGHVARDNPRYLDTILDVLCAFIRTQKPEGIGPDNEWIEKDEAKAENCTGVTEEATSVERDYPPAPPDVCAALDEVVKLNPEARRAMRRRSRLYRTKENTLRRYGSILLRLKRSGRMRRGVGRWLMDRWFDRESKQYFGNPYSRRFDLRGAYLVGVEQSGAVLSNANFLGANLTWAVFDEAYLEHCEFSAAQLEGTRFWEAILDRSVFDDANLTGASFVNAYLVDAIFRDACLESAVFSGEHLIGTVFSGARLELAEFSRARIKSVNFRYARLHSAKFRKAHLDKAQFEDAALDNADFGGADLSSVEDLIQAQIDSFYGDDETKLPRRLNPTFQRHQQDTATHGD